MASSKKLGTAELLFRRAQQMGLQPAWVTPGGLFVVHTTDGEKYINFARSPLNTQVSASLAKDKYLTRLILERHNLPNIPFARPQTLAEATAFLRKYSKIIVKPVGGQGSHDIHIVSHARELTMEIKRYIFEQYVVGKEMRYLVLNNHVIAVHQSEYGTFVDEDRALQRISYPGEEWDPTLIELSLRITSVLGLKFAAVDYLVDEHGDVHFLEVNSTPGLKWFHAPTSGPPVNVASVFLEAMLEQLRGQNPPLSRDQLGILPPKAYS